MQLDVTSLSAGYGRMTILHDLNFAAKPGEITCLLGPNGAGKSTLMKALAGQLAVTAGDITLDGRSVVGLGPLQIGKLGVGYVPQEHNVFTELSVQDNLRASSLAFRGGEGRIEEVYKRFTILKDRSRQMASTLSGGERQTLAIATALLAAPKILLLDEPTAGLAPIFIDRIVKWIGELAFDGMGVVWVVEQNPEHILSSSTMTFVMEAGRIREVLESKRLLEPGRLEAAML
ncbi:ATP-binding cassette domain-containing protein [Dongia sp.]|uniref:ATP-binding cassette domain-containing protein n=1 Tax=Dongia sp. TaxID=1977262 RepID=UPI0037515480